MDYTFVVYECMNTSLQCNGSKYDRKKHSSWFKSEKSPFESIYKALLVHSK